MSVPDVYFSLSYHLASGVLEPDFLDAVLVEWSDEQGVVRLPLLLRRIPNSKYLDATSAYDYGGPWMEGDPSLEKFFVYLDEWARENSVVCTFFRFHPLLKNVERMEPFISTRRVGVTFGWDLTGDKDPVTGISKAHKRKYRKAIREGLEARITVKPDDLDTFRDVYMQTMERLSARDFYRFSDDYWESLQEQIGDNIVLVEAIYQDEVVASALFLTGQSYIHYHLAATADLGRTLGASVFCNISAALWAKEKGYLYEHMGGGPGGESSTLLNWKHSFDPVATLNPLYVGGLVHDEEAYAALSVESMDKDFFPPWRAREVVSA